MPTIYSILSDLGVLSKIILTDETQAFLEVLSARVTTPPHDTANGTIQLGTVDLVGNFRRNPFGAFGLSLGSPDVLNGVAFKLQTRTAPAYFRLWVDLPHKEPAVSLFTIANDIPGMALTAAKLETLATGKSELVGLDGTGLALVLKSAHADVALWPCLVTEGREGQQARLSFAPGMAEDAPAGILHFGFNAPAVMFGNSGIGFAFEQGADGASDGFYLDDSEEASTLPVWPDGMEFQDEIKQPQWRGFLAPAATFYLPKSVPLFGGRPIKAHFAVGIGGARTHVVIDAKCPATDDPGFALRIECFDMTADGLAGLVPTNIVATAEFPPEKLAAAVPVKDGEPGKTLQFGSDKPVCITLSVSRNPMDSVAAFSTKLAISSQGGRGIISVLPKPGEDNVAAKIFITAAAMATAIMADKDVKKENDAGDMTTTGLLAILSAAPVATGLFKDNSGAFILHGVEVVTSGASLPIGGKMVLQLDYAVAVTVDKLGVAGFSVEMNADRPMRIRVKDLRMSLDPGVAGLEKFALDYSQSRMEIEDAGRWNLDGLDSLFDILDTRSGHGSTWFEIDLGFKLDTGPVYVTKTTIRISLENEVVTASMRGLGAGIRVPKLIEGDGKVQISDSGFAADFSAKLVPLQLGVSGSFGTNNSMTFIGLGVDLPAPIPLLNTGFGIFGVAGQFGHNAIPEYMRQDRPQPPTMDEKLGWSARREGFSEAPGIVSIGVEAVIGTLPDLGFSFSAKAGVVVTAPDFSVRASLYGRVLQPALKVQDKYDANRDGLNLLGMLLIDSAALTIGMSGTLNLKPLLEARAPFAGYFPFGNPGEWYVYLGADGHSLQDRAIGPISVRLLPGFLNTGADAYAMMRGNGFDAWPNRAGVVRRDVRGGYCVALGFSLQHSFGFKPVAWAELYLSADVLLATKPFLLAGFGRAGGSLHLGPFSLDVRAQVNFAYANTEEYLWLEVFGTIDLLFCEIEGKVTISYGNQQDLKVVPPPQFHPLDHLDGDGRIVGTLGSLCDDTYAVIAPLVTSPDELSDEGSVWADCLISLPFAIPPAVSADAGKQFPGVTGANKPRMAGETGTEMLRHVWTMDDIGLYDVTNVADPATDTSVRPAGLAARWQAPRASAGAADVNELILFSNQPDLWVNRLGDAGEGLAGDPIAATANLCNASSVSATYGWADGALADNRAGGYFLPANPLDLGPFASRLDASVKAGIHDPVTDLVYGFDLPAHEAIMVAPPQIVPLVAPFIFGERQFEGFLQIETASSLTGHGIRLRLEKRHHVELEPSEAIEDRRLILVVPTSGFTTVDSLKLATNAISVTDNLPGNWTSAPARDCMTANGPAVILVFEKPAAGPSRSVITISWPLGMSLGIVALGGVCASAAETARDENRAIAAEIQKRADAARAGPDDGTAPPSANRRTILTPGHTYRIDVGMSWKGTLTRRDPDGAPIVPLVEAGGVANRSLYFRVAAKAESLEQDHRTRILRLYAKLSTFQPDMLVRYLGGYEPAQGEPHHFCDDPVRVHFTQDHVVALSKAYGYDLVIAARRTDQHREAAPALVKPSLGFGTTTAFFSGADRRRFQLAQASLCVQPKPGLTASAVADLEPFAPYELFMQAKETSNLDAGRISGVTFRTSRWRSPMDMCAACGLTVTGGIEPADVLSGDLAIPVPAARAAAALNEGASDFLFQQALQTLELHQWPVASETRISRLWTGSAATGWKFAGMLFELPEPLHRPGRLELKGVDLEMGAAGNNVRFDRLIFDRTGARMIVMTATPFTVVVSEPAVNPFDPNGGRGGIGRRKGQPGRGQGLGGLVRDMQVAIRPMLTLMLDDLTASSRITARVAVPQLPDFVEDAT